MNPSSEVWAILDLRGLIIHAYNSGLDPDSSDPKLRSPGYTLGVFIDRYLLPISELVPLNRIIAVHDGGNDYRRGLREDYKNRPPMEPGLKESVDRSETAVKQLLHSLGILNAVVAGTEADDVIAYLDEKLPGSKLIYTVDGDLIALAKPNTAVFLKGEPHEVLRKKADVSVDGVKTKVEINIQPRHVTLFKSIVGDSSDNIKGIPGMGPKAWLDLVEAFGEDGLDELNEIVDSEDYAKLKNIIDTDPHPLLSKILAGVHDWHISYLLGKLRPELIDAKYKDAFRRIQWGKRLPDPDRLHRLAKSENANWLPGTVKHLLPTQTLILAEDWDDTVLDEAEALFKDSRFVSIDWETWAPANANFNKAATGEYVDMLSSRITGAGITCGQNLEHTFYFNFEHADTENCIPKENLVELLKRIPAGMPIICQNAIFERTVLFNELGYDIPNLHDTKIMASHVDESLPAGLKDMSKHWLNYNQIKYKDVIEEGKTMHDYPAAHVFKYGADDPLVTGHLYDLFYVILNLENTWEFVRDQEFMMTYTLSDSYLAGVSIDFEEVERQHQEDKLTLDTNISAIRDLLRLNITPETIYQGASSWMEELVANHAGEAKYLKDLIQDAAKKHGIHAGKALMEDKILMKWVPDAVTEGSSPEDIILAVEEKLVRDSVTDLAHSTARSKLWQEAVESATYYEYEESYKPASFSWSLGKVNQLAELYKLPAWPCLNDLVAMKEHRASLGEQPVMTNHYLDMVLVTAELAISKRHTKAESYLWLKDQYVNNFEGTLVKSGTELNLDSPVQMARFFYAMLGLPIRLRSFEVSEAREKKGLEGAPQTDKDVVAMAIAMGDATGWKLEVLDLMTEAKNAATRIKLFYNKLPLWKHPIDGLIHPQFNSVGTETRRPSGNSPNLLQLSKRGEGVKVRKCFIPNQKRGHNVIVSLDWDGEELRIMGGLSGDAMMTSCYIGDNKRNVHSITGAGIAGVPYEEFTRILKDEDHELCHKYSDIRKDSKNVNFLSAYGGGAAKLARKLLCSVEVAKEYLDAKKAAYPGIEEWRKRRIESLHATGFVRTLFGSRKHVYSKLCGKDEGLVSYYERSSINFEIQGVAADYLKKVLADLLRGEILKKHDAILYAAIYDELVFSLHSDNAVEFVQDVYDVMTQGIPGLPIPMLANPSIGVNFADQHEILKDADDPLTEDKILAALAKSLGSQETA